MGTRTLHDRTSDAEYHDQNKSFLGRVYTDREEFITKDHQDIQDVLAPSFLGSMMEGRRDMPRKGKRKGDKRAMRSSPLHTRDETNERALAQH